MVWAELWWFSYLGHIWTVEAGMIDFEEWLAKDLAAVKKTHEELKRDRTKPVIENFDWEAIKEISDQFNQS